MLELEHGAIVDRNACIFCHLGLYRNGTFIVEQVIPSGAVQAHQADRLSCSPGCSVPFLTCSLLLASAPMLKLKRIIAARPDFGSRLQPGSCAELHPGHAQSHGSLCVGCCCRLATTCLTIPTVSQALQEGCGMALCAQPG